MAATGGALYFLGHVGWGMWPCLLPSLALLWCALERAPARGPGTAFLLGLLFGLVAYIGGFNTLWPLVDTFFDGRPWLGLSLWVAYGFWFAGAFAVYASLTTMLRRRGWPVAVAGTASLVAVEWLHPQIFPVYAGAALIRAPLWASQTADLGGPLLLTMLVAGANVVVFETWAWRQGQRSRPIAAWLVGLLGLGSVLVYGNVRVAMIDAANAKAPGLDVGIVQANLDPRDAPKLGVEAHRRHLALTRELLAAQPLDLIVWPESAHGRGLRRPLPVSGRPVAAEIEVPILFGGRSVVQEGGRRVTYNSAFLIERDGTIRNAYDKNLLIPLAEQVPIPGLAPYLPHAGTYRASRETRALNLDTWRIATPICYEAIRPVFVRRMVADTNPHLLVTLANDAYFGNSRMPWMHLAMARLRAIEHRRYLVRATNSGVSAIIDPAGRVRAETPLLAPATLSARVGLRDGATLYGRIGEWPGWLCAAVVALALLIPYRPRQKRRESSRRPDCGG